MGPRRGAALAAACLAGACALLAGRASGQEARAPLLEDCSTPRRALRQFIVACRAGDFERAATHLDLRGLDAATAAQAPLLARRLKFVMDQTLWVEWEEVSDEPRGRPLGLPFLEVVGSVPIADDAVPVVLTGEEGEGGAPPRWRIGAATVRQIPALHAAHGPPAWLDERIPAALHAHRLLELEAWQWVGLVAVLPASWLAGALLAWAVLLLGVVTRRTRIEWDDRLLEAVRPPLRFFLALLALEWLAAPLRLSAPAHEVLHDVRAVLLAATVAWTCVRLVSFVAQTLEGTLTHGLTDEAQVRGVRTQVVILRRIVAVVVCVVACALVLTRFEVVRTIGMSLLASAGVAGIVIGLAAQRSISAILAGVQLSITQPIRIGDTVIVEGEWGWIEEIHLTYVVVKVWDLRRLVVPINRFLEAPFQNWTKVSPEIMGTVELFVDYATPVDRVRAELQRICRESSHWDGRVCGLQVTAVSPQTVTLRALVSSANAGTNWDLRCEVRERLVGHLQRLEGGRYLPRARVDQASRGDEVAAAPAGAPPKVTDAVPDAAVIAAAAIVDPPAGR
ncbi:MAG: mechanosensitive ion channel [Planctomycetes bacterium]|nr:mechanosensitive ion channel [Planctomycetota bacterium]